MPISLTCPECDKKFRGPDTVAGKKIKCPACGSPFVAGNGQAVGAGPPPGRAEPKMAPEVAAVKKDDDELDEDGNPYGVGFLDIRPMCPNCANEMASKDAFVCLFCGYNTQTRTVGTTTKTIAHTGGDRTAWLAPGVGCVIGIFLIVMFDITFTVGLPVWTVGSNFWSWFTNEAAKLWITLLTLPGMYALGRFALKRILLEPTPPEKLIEG